MPVISVIICTRNPRENYLRRVFDALKAQTLAKENWELLLIDNASTPALAGVWDLAWHPQARHVREETLGLTPARLRGIAESKGDLLVFVDDDNVLRSDYLEAVCKIAADYAWLGAWSGSCLAEFEAKPPTELQPWLAGLVIEKLATPLWARLSKTTEACPMGAGLVLRRQQAWHYRSLAMNDPRRKALDRCGKKLNGGGDTDMALCGFELGLGTGRFPELELTHLIPAARLTLEYIAGINEGFGYASVMLNAIHGKPDPLPGQIQTGNLKLLLLNIFLLVSGKNRVERRIRLAIEKGRLRAQIELKRLSYRQSPPVSDFKADKN